MGREGVPRRLGAGKIGRGPREPARDDGAESPVEAPRALGGPEDVPGDVQSAGAGRERVPEGSGDLELRLDGVDRVCGAGGEREGGGSS